MKSIVTAVLLALAPWNGVDIPFGNVRGLRYDVVVNDNMTNRVWQIGTARVGAYRQINRTPRHD